MKKQTRSFKYVKRVLKKHITNLQKFCHNSGCNDIHNCPVWHIQCEKKLNLTTAVIWSIAMDMTNLEKFENLRFITIANCDEIYGGLDTSAFIYRQHKEKYFTKEQQIIIDESFNFAYKILSYIRSRIKRNNKQHLLMSFMFYDIKNTKHKKK